MSTILLIFCHYSIFANKIKLKNVDSELPKSGISQRVYNQSMRKLTKFYGQLLEEFLLLMSVKGEELSEEVKQLSFPRQHRHKLCCLRSELIETFVE